MRKTYTYEGVLSAVGRVLDEAGVTQIAITETADGLMVEGLDGSGQSRVSLPFDVPNLYALISRGSESQTPSQIATIADEGTLRHFLDQHELVGVR